MVGLPPIRFGCLAIRMADNLKMLYTLMNMIPSRLIGFYFIAAFACSDATPIHYTGPSHVWQMTVLQQIRCL